MFAEMTLKLDKEIMGFFLLSTPFTRSLGKSDSSQSVSSGYMKAYALLAREWVDSTALTRDAMLLRHTSLTIWLKEARWVSFCSVRTVDASP